MTRAGPPLEALLRRIIDTPPDFLVEPATGTGSGVRVDAIVADVAALYGARAPVESLAPFAASNEGVRNRLALALLACWLLAGEWFRDLGLAPADALRALDATASELSPHASASSFHSDADRREELVRTLLARLGLRPEGETEAQAQDRLSSVSAAERQRIVAAARGANERARKIREALAKKAAEESADKMWRE